MASYASPMPIRRDVAQLVRPPNREPVSQSAARLLYVEQSGSMVPWDGALVPYMHEPMDCLKSRLYDAVIYAGPARTGKTVSVVDGWVMDTIANNPGDFLLVQISQDKAAEYSKKRLGREFAASAEIRAAMSPRAHDNNVHDKVFKAGNFLKIGWPSKTIFASSDWKYVALTDYDRMQLNIDGEGSGFILAGKRTQTFMSSGMVLAESSPGFLIIDPTYRVKSPHEAPPTRGILSLYNQGDRRLYHWQCPDCRLYFEPDFALLQYDETEPDPARASREVVLVCPCCGVPWREDQQLEGQALKLALNATGRWIPQGCEVDETGQLVGEARETRIASFWQKGPTAAFQSWNQLVYKYLAAKAEYESTGNLEDLQATVNTDQGKPFTPPSTQERSANELMARAYDMGDRVVPSWVRFLTAAVDVQAGAKTARFEVMVLGWGVDLECAVIDRFKIQKAKRKHPDDPEKFVRVDPAAHLEDWDLLTERVINKSYPLSDESGRRMPILVTACDSGGEGKKGGTVSVTDTAYEYYRGLKKQNLARRFMLIKGRGAGPKVEESYPDNTKRKDRKAKARGDVPVHLLHANLIKDTYANALAREERGRRYIHFPDWLPESFFDELLAEERGTDGKWDKISTGVRNESIDLFVYNWACIYQREADRMNWELPKSWARPWDENPNIEDPHDPPAAPVKSAAPRRRGTRIRFN